MTQHPGLIERMKRQLSEWEDDEPRSDWWQYQRDHAEAADAIAELVEALRKLESDCMANDFNEHWDSYIAARSILAKHTETK